MGHYVGFGHSHIASITWACEEMEETDPGRILHATVNFLLPPYFPEVSHQDGGQTLNPHWIATMRWELQDHDAIVFLCVSGSEWWRWSLTPGPEPFDFVDPEHDDGLMPIGQLVPYDLFMHKARLAFAGIRFVAETVRRFTSAPLVQLAPPPPSRDVETAVNADPTLRPLIAGYGVSPSAFRLKVWRACARAMQQVCADTGIDFLMPPPEGLDTDGFLRPELVHDHIHGNAAWGRLQLHRLAAWAGRAAL